MPRRYDNRINHGWEDDRYGSNGHIGKIGNYPTIKNCIGIATIRTNNVDDVSFGAATIIYVCLSMITDIPGSTLFHGHLFFVSPFNPFEMIISTIGPSNDIPLLSSLMSYTVMEQMISSRSS